MRSFLRALAGGLCLAALPAIPVLGVDFLTDWEDQAIIYGAGPEKAYYPSFLYDAAGFPDGDGPGDPYMMWYASSNGATKAATSADGLLFTPEPGVDVGVTNSNHPAVLFEPDGFSPTGPDGPATMHYRLYFWDMGALYDNTGPTACRPTCMIGYAESDDGFTFYNQGWISQAGPGQVIPHATDPSSPWRGSYGPFQVLFDRTVPAGSGRNADEPMANRYVMYYDLTTGGDEVIGLAFSDDGLDWEGYQGNPVVRGTQNWETCGEPPTTNCREYVSRAHVILHGGTYTMYYSGGHLSMNNGIGLATSPDGVTWTKDDRNPMLHKDPALNKIDTDPPGDCYRNDRAYTPSIVDDGSGTWKLYYTGRSRNCNPDDDRDYALGLLELPMALRLDIDLRPGSDDNHVNSNAKMLVPVAIFGTADFEPDEDLELYSLRIRGATPSFTKFDVEDVNGDGWEDMVVYIRARDIDPKPGPAECDDPDATITLTGSTTEGTPVTGSDHVRWLGPDCRE